MIERVDRKTLVCHAHGVEACIVCMTDDLQDFHYSRIERRKTRKRIWRDMSINEKFDLGGES